MQVNKKGFTLVELLVVIAIVAVLAGVVLVSINPAKIMSESRDATRLSDMDTLNKAITLAIADEEYTLVAVQGSSLTGSIAVDGTGWVGYTKPAGKVGLGKYLAVLPRDPEHIKGLLAYEYKANVDGHVLRSQLQSLKYASKMTTDGGASIAHYEVGTDPGLDLFGAP